MDEAIKAAKERKVPNWVGKKYFKKLLIFNRIRNKLLYTVYEYILFTKNTIEWIRKVYDLLK